jgi:excisionase family DNA binding protein
MEEKEKLLYVRTVMERLCCSKNYVYALIQSGQLEAYRVGSHLRVVEKSVDEYLEKRKVVANEKFSL